MKNLLMILISAAILTLFLFSCTDHIEGEEVKTGIPVKLVKVKNHRFSFPISASGILANSAEMKLSFKTGGILGEIVVEEGENVRKGQLLARLKQNEISANVQQAKSGYEKAMRDHKRVQKLYEDKVATLEQLQNSKTAMDVAAASNEIALFNLRHSSIYAPVTGRILMRFVEENEMIGPGAPVFILGSHEQAWIIRTAIVDRDILSLTLGDSSEIEFDAYPENNFTGIVQTIGGAAHPATGLFEVEIRLNDADARLLSGFIGRIKIFPGKGKEYSLIPISSITEGSGMIASVFTVDKETSSAKKVKVQIAAIYNASVYVSSGLENVTEVISEGTPYVNDKVSVAIIESDSN